MAVVTIPSDLLPIISRQSFGNRYFDLSFSSDLTGATQTRMLAPPRWRSGLFAPDALDPSDVAIWRAFVMSLRGQVNQVAVWDFLAAAARADLTDAFKGSPVLSANVAVGDESIHLVDATQAGKWWRKGEYVGLGQGGATRQLFMVMENAQANGSGQIELVVEPPPRYAASAGAAASWDKPTCLMKRTTAESNWDTNGPTGGGFSLDLVESWEVGS